MRNKGLMTAKGHQLFILSSQVSTKSRQILPTFTGKKRAHVTRAQVISHKDTSQKRTLGKVGKYRGIDISELEIRDQVQKGEIAKISVLLRFFSFFNKN